MDIGTMFFLHYFHLIGMIVGMGAAIVIETFGMISRKSPFWTSVTINAHYVTKPLIWIGTIIFGITWFLIMGMNALAFPYAYKTLLLAVLFMNGSYLSFIISPRLIRHKKENENSTLPLKLQVMIIPSALISSLGWLIMVFLTVLFWV